MGILKKTISVLMLVFFVASLTVGSASAGYSDWGCRDNFGCHKDRCDCFRDRCDCFRDRCDCCNFDFEAFYGGSFFGTNCLFENGCFFGEDGNWFDDWIN